jgi:hypothetical protein
MRHLRAQAAGWMVVAASSIAAGQQNVVFPDLPHAASNTIPFSQAAMTHHQVYASSLFEALYGGAPVRIERVAWAPTSTVSFDAHIELRLGYTSRSPGQLLLVPQQGGGGAPNATGPMHLFYEGQHQLAVLNDPEDFRTGIRL